MAADRISRILKRGWGSVPRPVRDTLFRPRSPLERWREWHRFYDLDPFRVAADRPNRAEYEELAREASAAVEDSFLEDVRNRTGFLPERRWVDDLAAVTQVVRRPEGVPNNYAHGFLLYGLVRSMVEREHDVSNFVVLETGTARGFSTVCMAKAMADSGRPATIVTIDVLHADRRIRWNSVSDVDGPRTRFELLEPWRPLLERYVVFLRGRSEVVIEQLGLARIHFAFLDGAHDYEHLSGELEFVAGRQQPGDRILCDDYSMSEFPGIVRAVDEITATGRYRAERFRSSAVREQVLLERIE